MWCDCQWDIYHIESKEREFKQLYICRSPIAVRDIKYIHVLYVSTRNNIQIYFMQRFIISSQLGHISIWQTIFAFLYVNFIHINES